MSVYGVIEMGIVFGIIWLIVCFVMLGPVGLLGGMGIWFIIAAMIEIMNATTSALTTKKCPHCKGVIPKGVAVCQHCGRDVKPKKKSMMDKAVDWMVL